ncbi:hypothetical protein bplSymb_SCF02903P002 [Bathymodiolus platifrons methanotrophic gill symbiont]|uniref:hypothetical protein n=1 Tax=Bathymodiolus platifrons methanotrophic gill symbiont TaxID=113268 RepID=UPI000B40F889|nr:hypothetical protein [Bathymodiolus platifrons methanotrophic gill symbiont]TXK98482.1 hypothetical protein BMR02_08795 [Methylococcaceae bacterium HT1]TXL16061.1 hypothetical protein BMR04_10795 [Methylococcaceae bacterium HT3]TXL22491.1 hypothetical protein BMR03_07965 [Methylococcaceae bacterium HT2]GAW86506.1 hypothetical protein bplSymb_SCF02903P002 [Bathymodiolus platifrons methanotrophic gill symbiont]
MDFEFSQHDKGLNIDIRPSRDSCMDGYFELSHYRVPYFQNGSDRLGYKLSETNPDLNGCIVGSVSDSFAKYKLEKGNALRHTLALDKWVEIKKVRDTVHSIKDNLRYEEHYPGGNSRLKPLGHKIWTICNEK